MDALPTRSWRPHPDLAHPMTLLRITTAWLALGLGFLLLSQDSSAQASIYASGCSGLNPTPGISHSGTPAPFALQTIHLSGMPPGALAMFLMGVSNTDGLGNPLEIDLSGITGMNPGCTLNTSGELVFFLTADGSGEASFSFPYKLLFVNRKVEY